MSSLESRIEGPFSPTRGRAVLVVLFGAVLFWIPQNPPLQWYEPHFPHANLLYLEVTCRADGAGRFVLVPVFGKELQSQHTIELPLTESTVAFTYVFPLADGLLRRLELSFEGDGSILHVQNLRIHDRSGKTIRQISSSEVQGAVRAFASSRGEAPWTWDGGTGGSAMVEFNPSLWAEGFVERILYRLLLSIGYLTLWLWILLLAILVILQRSIHMSILFRQARFLALIALIFSCVGQRGMLREAANLLWSLF